MKKENSLPCFEIGKEELEKRPHLFGDKAMCPRCHRDHLIRYGINTKTGRMSDTLAFVICKNNMSYLVAINNRII